MSPLRLGSFGELANSRRLGRVGLSLTPGKLVVAKSVCRIGPHVGEGREESPASLVAEQISALCDAFAGATGWRLSIQGESRLHKRAQWLPADRGRRKGLWLDPALHAVPSTPPPATRRPTKSKSATASSAEPSRSPASQPDRQPQRDWCSRTSARSPEPSPACSLKCSSCGYRSGIRQAELAAGVPVAPRPDEAARTSPNGWKPVLQAGAEAVGCYLRGSICWMKEPPRSNCGPSMVCLIPACWSAAAPPRSRCRFRGAGRSRRGAGRHFALAPLEVPEAFPAAACVPVSTSSAPLGTLWVFADEDLAISRESKPTCSRLSPGAWLPILEREMLLTASEASRKTDQQIAPATNWQRDRLPSIQPLIDNYEVAGWTEQAGPLGGDFHDWCVLNDGQLALSAGSAFGRHVDRRARRRGAAWRLERPRPGARMIRAKCSDS